MFVFVGATLLMVGAVIVAGAVDQWWVLVPVLLIGTATTTSGSRSSHADTAPSSLRSARA